MTLSNYGKFPPEREEHWIPSGLGQWSWWWCIPSTSRPVRWGSSPGVSRLVMAGEKPCPGGSGVRSLPSPCSCEQSFFSQGWGSNKQTLGRVPQGGCSPCCISLFADVPSLWPFCLIFFFFFPLNTLGYKQCVAVLHTKWDSEEMLPHTRKQG